MYSKESPDPTVLSAFLLVHCPDGVDDRGYGFSAACIVASVGSEEEPPGLMVRGDPQGRAYSCLPVIGAGAQGH